MSTPTIVPVAPTCRDRETFTFGPYRWSVSALVQAADRAQATTIDPSGWMVLYGGMVTIYQERVAALRAADLARPVLVVSLPADRAGDPPPTVVADGWHRIAYAHQHGIRSIPALRFDVPARRAALTSTSARY